MRRRAFPQIAPVLLVLATGCNGGLEQIAAPTTCPRAFVGICGTVTFRGRVPDSTAGVYVVAYSTFPRGPNELLTFLPVLPQPLPLPGDSTTFYSVPLPNGHYEWVVAAWRKQGVLAPDFSNADSLLQEAGFYRDGADTTAHGTGIVRVNGTGTDGINIIVDFNAMHPISYYFPQP